MCLLGYKKLYEICSYTIVSCKTNELQLYLIYFHEKHQSTNGYYHSVQKRFIESNEKAMFD